MTELYFTNDTVEVDLGLDSVETDSEGKVVDFSLDKERIVTVENVPWREGFDTDKFYSAEATVARPVKQTYLYDGEEKTFRKPAEELKKSAWSLDNKPFTTGHPETPSGRVRGRPDVDGFWREPSYDSDKDELNAQLYIPVDDRETLEYVAENDNVSVGFSHRIRHAPDDEGVDGHQVDLYYDHVASVEEGRCSDEDGCGIELDSVVNVTDNEYGYSITPSYGAFSKDADDGTTGIYFDNDYRDEEGTYYALSPEEGKGQPKYPIRDCSDAEDAWNLRNHGDYLPSTETLERRIKRRATDLECDNMPWENENDSKSDTMTDNDCGCGTQDGGVDVSVSSFSVDAIRERNDEVQELFEEKQELEEQVDEYEEELEEYEGVQEEIDTLREELDEYKSQERQEIVDSITDITSTWDEDELTELSVDELEERHELAKDIASESGTANPDGGSDGGKTETDSSPVGTTGKTVDPRGNFS